MRILSDLTMVFFWPGRPAYQYIELYDNAANQNILSETWIEGDEDDE